MPVEFDEERFLIEEPDVKALVGIYEELEFRSHIKKLGIRNEELGVKDNSGMGSLFDSEELGVSSEELTNPSAYGSSPNLGEQLGGAQLSTFNSQLSNYVCVDTEEKQSELVEMLKGVKMFAFETETTSLDVLDAELVGFSFAIKSTVNSQQSIAYGVLCAGECG